MAVPRPLLRLSPRLWVQISCHVLDPEVLILLLVVSELILLEHFLRRACVL